VLAYICMTSPTLLLPPLVSAFITVNSPLAIVVALSLLIGLSMVVVFRYTSDQKAIRLAKDQLKAHLLAVRLFQDQLPVVLSSYARILRGTGRYLRLAFRPLLFVAIPLTLLIVQLDRYLGMTSFQAGQPFLVKVQTVSPETLDGVLLHLPPEISTTALAVHVPTEKEIVWRVVAGKAGNYEIEVGDTARSFRKNVVVSSGLARLSAVRLRGRWWERFFISGEPALPENSAIQSIAVNYPDRTLRFAWVEWNWIWLFFVLSLLAGFFFKTVLRIEI
jgi:hypothetical protein